MNQRVEIRTFANGKKLRLNIYNYAGGEPAFVLVHGLASNARTWDRLAQLLSGAGHRVVTVDQRGHGLSDKPDEGYDFATVAEDLLLLINKLELRRPVLAGQSWGGNVALAFGATFPEAVRGIAFVDGGYLDLQMRPGATWQRIEQELRPPKLLGTPRSVLKERLRSFHPDWDEIGIDGTLANFETLADGTVRPWLTLPRHMTILRALWEQRPSNLYSKVLAPVLICAACRGENHSHEEMKQRQVRVALQGLPLAHVEWFDETDHDIHVHRPQRLAALFLETLERGIWSEQSK